MATFLSSRFCFNTVITIVGSQNQLEILFSGFPKVVIQLTIIKLPVKTCFASKHAKHLN